MKSALSQNQGTILVRLQSGVSGEEGSCMLGQLVSWNLFLAVVGLRCLFLYWLSVQAVSQLPRLPARLLM